jgi:hypothetical protein
MLRLRFRIDHHPRTKKGRPPHRTTGVPRRKLDPGQDAARDDAVQGAPRDVFAHGDKEERHRQECADQETPAHVAQFPVFLILSGDRAGLKGHATLRAAS